MLPILEARDRILAAVRASNRLVLTAPPGSGKTTQVPQLLHRADICKGRIVVLQPRRLATRMVAARVASEMQVELGGLVGFQTRHEGRVSKATRILFLTEGLFLRWMQANPQLPGVGCVVLDEFHERSLAADMILGLTRLRQEQSRGDVKLIVMSATLDASAISSYLACPVVEASGRMYPVDIRYLSSRSPRPPWEQAADAAMRIIDAGEEGHLLVFMSGAYEINRTMDACRTALRGTENVALLPLHGGLSPREQDAAVAPSVQRKIIVATNIAETSITIDGVRHVIDSGVAKVHRYDSRRGLNVLLPEPISQASAAQRAGRAGRTAPGTCTRLWPQGEHVHRPAHDDPEILRVDLAEMVLELKAMGVAEVRRFPWLQAPAEQAVQRGEELLRALHALSDSPPFQGGAGGGPGAGKSAAMEVLQDGSESANGRETTTHGSTLPQPLPKREGSSQLTDIGQQMAAFPLHPRLSRMLIEAARRGCLRRAVLWAALISERSILMGEPPAAMRELPEGEPRSDLLIIERSFDAAAAGDFHIRTCDGLNVNAQACREVDRTRRQLADICRGADMPFDGTGGTVELLKCLLTAFPDHVALRPDAQRLDCRMTGKKRVTLDKFSIAKRPGLLLAIDVRETGAGEGVKTALSLVSEIEPSWLEEVHADRIVVRDEVEWNNDAKAVEQVETHLFDGLIFFRKARQQVDPRAAAPVLVSKIVEGEVKLEKWDEQVTQWITRTRLVGRWFPQRGLITYDAEDVSVILHEIVGDAVRFSQVRDRPCLDAVMNALSWQEQQFVREMAPEAIPLPRGWRMKIEYSEEGPPRGRAKIQDLYDLHQSPRVAAGRVPVLLEILGPNHRPVQVTDDLASFWRNTYPELRKNLARRYPRHEWR